MRTTPTIDPDEELVTACAQGDQTAFAKLETKYAPLLKRLLSGKSVVGNAPDDMAQEARVTLYTAIRAFRTGEGATFFTFLHKLLENRFANMIRRVETNRRRVELMETTFSALQRGDSEGVESAYDPACDDVGYADVDESVAILSDSKDLPNSHRIVAALLVRGYGLSEVDSFLGIEARDSRRIVKTFRKL